MACMHMLRHARQARCCSNSMIMRRSQHIFHITARHVCTCSASTAGTLLQHSMIMRRCRPRGLRAQTRRWRAPAGARRTSRRCGRAPRRRPQSPPGTPPAGPGSVTRGNIPVTTESLDPLPFGSARRSSHHRCTNMQLVDRCICGLAAAHMLGAVSAPFHSCSAGSLAGGPNIIRTEHGPHP